MMRATRGLSVLMRRTFVAAVSWCLVFCSAAASAQEVTDAVVEGLPQRIRHAEATSRGDLLLALGPEAEAPMMQVIALRWRSSAS